METRKRGMPRKTSLGAVIVHSISVWLKEINAKNVIDGDAGLILCPV